MVLADSCVYTIASIDKLAPAAAEGGPFVGTERSRWVTAQRLWVRAQKDGLAFPVVLGDAKDCSALLYWGVLVDLEVGEQHTTYTIDRLRAVEPGHTPQELVLRSSGKTIAPGYIWPYALCRTPAFLTPVPATGGRGIATT